MTGVGKVRSQSAISHRNYMNFGGKAETRASDARGIAGRRSPTVVRSVCIRRKEDGPVTHPNPLLASISGTLCALSAVIPCSAGAEKGKTRHTKRGSGQRYGVLAATLGGYATHQNLGGNVSFLLACTVLYLAAGSG